MLLQQSTWQNNVRMSNLVEQVKIYFGLLNDIVEYYNDVFILFTQIRGPLSSIRTLSKMLSVQVKRSEVVTYSISQAVLKLLITVGLISFVCTED